MMKHITSAEFASETAQGLALVDFSATWCGPCKMLAPVLEELSGEYEGRVKFLGVDVDESGDLAQKYRVSAVPTVVLLKDGELVAQKTGFSPKAAYQAWIDGNL